MHSLVQGAHGPCVFLWTVRFKVHDCAFSFVRTSTFVFLSLFHPFLFELAFGVNMKVLDKDVRFLMLLV